MLRKGFIEFRAIITRLIERIIIPLLPLHIFGIFLNLTYTGAAGAVMKALLRVVVVVLILEVVILASSSSPQDSSAAATRSRHCSPCFRHT